MNCFCYAHYELVVGNAGLRDNFTLLIHKQPPPLTNQPTLPRTLLVRNVVGGGLLVDVDQHSLHAFRRCTHWHLDAIHIRRGYVGGLWRDTIGEHHLCAATPASQRHTTPTTAPSISQAKRRQEKETHKHSITAPQRTSSGGGGLRMNLEPPGMYGTTYGSGCVYLKSSSSASAITRRTTLRGR